MKYEPPYGSPGSNDPYINGNPATGTMGSIPPAASIENPQREIVNFITDSTLTPTDADLHQLSKSVQFGKVNYYADQGTANFIAITPTPAVAAYAPGLHFRIKVANNNTGPTQVNASNVGWQPLVHSADQSPVGSGELFPGQIIEITWDGTHWQILSGGTGGGGGLIQMTAPRTLYLDAAIGNDTYDGSQPTVDAPHNHGPMLTLRHALSVMTKYNLGGWTFTIQFADGTYPDPALIDMPTPNGSGEILLQGNRSNPQNVKLVNTGAGSVIRNSGGFYFLDGLYFQSTAQGTNDNGNGVTTQGAGSTWFAAVAFGSCWGNHIQVGPSGGAGMSGPISIYGSALNGAHIASVQNGSIQTLGSPRPSLTILNPITVVSFVVAQGGGQMIIWYSPMNGAANVTGQKYAASGNGVINSGGNGASFYPGTVAGVTVSGGQYL